MNLFNSKLNLALFGIILGLALTSFYLNAKHELEKTKRVQAEKDLQTASDAFNKSLIIEREVALKEGKAKADKKVVVRYIKELDDVKKKKQIKKAEKNETNQNDDDSFVTLSF